VQGSLNADGATSGGSITVQVASSNLLELNGSSLFNVVTGTISARGAAGNGGAVSITNNGSGGMDLASTEALSVKTTGGNGGSILMAAPNGPMTIAAGHLSADADFSDPNGAYSGGTLQISALSLTAPGLVLRARG